MGESARHRYHVLSSAWARYGEEHFVTKLGKRYWVVTVEGTDTPTLFKTKREALAHADARVMATMLRLREAMEEEEAG